MAEIRGSDSNHAGRITEAAYGTKSKEGPSRRELATSLLMEGAAKAGFSAIESSLAPLKNKKKEHQFSWTVEDVTRGGGKKSQATHATTLITKTAGLIFRATARNESTPKALPPSTNVKHVRRPPGAH